MRGAVGIPRVFSPRKSSRVLEWNILEGKGYVSQ